MFSNSGVRRRSENERIRPLVIFWRFATANNFVCPVCCWWSCFQIKILCSPRKNSQIKMAALTLFDSTVRPINPNLPSKVLFTWCGHINLFGGLVIINWMDENC